MTDTEDRLDRLESLVEQQQETIEAQQATIDQQRDRIDELDGETDTDSDETPLLANRRTALKAGGLAALLFSGVGTASADPQGQVGTSSNPLKKLYTKELYAKELNGGLTGGQTLTDLAGSNLSINNSGALEASGGGGSSSEL